MKRTSSASAYEPLIGYSRAVVSDGMVYVSGTTGLAPDDPGSPPVTDQCERALSRIEAALSEVGASFQDVVRVRYLLPNRDEFEPCWPLLRAAFGDAPPAATMIEAGLIDPRMRIEIEVTARLPDDR